MAKKHNIIEKLAIHYSAFREATLRRNDNAIACWGKMLLKTQAQLEVDLVDVKNTEAMIKDALRRLEL